MLEQAVRKAHQYQLGGDYLNAERLYDQIVANDPEEPLSVYLYGCLLLDTQRIGLAMQVLSRAMDLAHAQGKQKSMAYIPNALGSVYRTIGQPEAARKLYNYAIELDPTDPSPLMNLGGLYINEGNPSEALRLCDQVLERHPEDARTLKHKGLALLELGRFSEGWEFYKNRYHVDPDRPTREFNPRPYTCRHWDGEEVDCLAIHGEQGLGDEVLFLSFLKEAKKRAKTVVIECNHRLVKLFERSFGVKCYPDHDSLIKENNPDAYCPMGSLGCYVGPVPDGLPYLVADPDRVEFYRQELRKTGAGPFVALSWKGGTVKTHQHVRNASISHWKRLLDTPCSFVSVQYGDAGQSANDLEIPHWQKSIDDIDELAALIRACDLVVSVCNTTIHLAGALGVPCWVLTPSKPAWRYGMSGTSVPWYQSVKLYRQTGSWDEVFQQVKKDLNEKATGIRTTDAAYERTGSVALRTGT